MPHDYDEDLNEYLIDNPDSRTHTYGEAWEPLNDADAEFCLRNLSSAQDEIQRIEIAAEREMERIKAWQELASGPLLEDVQKWENRLVGYYKRLERENPDLKATYPLPSGTIRRTAGRERVIVEDETAFGMWAVANIPGLVEFKPLKVDIVRSKRLQTITDRKALKETARRSPTGARSQVIDAESGEKVPGVQIEIGPSSYSARPS